MVSPDLIGMTDGSIRLYKDNDTELDGSQLLQPVSLSSIRKHTVVRQIIYEVGDEDHCIRNLRGSVRRTRRDLMQR